MARRERVMPTAPGEGLIAIQTPLAALLESTVGIDAYIRLVRGGELDLARRVIKFNSSPGAVEKFRERGQELPDGLPDIQGDVSWRREKRRWSLDANNATLTPDVFFWSAVTKGVAQVRFDGVLIPDTIIDNLAGRRLRDVVEHPFLDHPDILIVSATTGGPYPSTTGIGNGRPAMTSFRITVPVITVPDPVIKT